MLLDDGREMMTLKYQDVVSIYTTMVVFCGHSRGKRWLSDEISRAHHDCRTFWHTDLRLFGRFPRPKTLSKSQGLR